MIYIDFETRSELDLKIVGAWKYSLHPSTEVLCMGYISDNMSYSRLWTPDYAPQLWATPGYDLTWHREYCIEAHNASFEFAIWHNIMVPRYNWPCIPEDQWYCSAAKAAYHGLPRALEDAALALGLDVQKDTEGSRLMQQMAKPRPNWKKTGTGPKWFDDEARLPRLYEYCKRDVEVEYALSQALDDLPKTERKLWLLDQKINRRGVYCDVELAQSAIEIIDTLEADGDFELYQLTNGIVATSGQIDKIRDWLVGEDLGLPNLQASVIDETLKRDDLTPKARRVLEIRQIHSKASTRKFKAMINRTHNGRIHDTLIYHGAHTGRWSGVGIQPHNFYRPDFKRSEIEFLAIPTIKQHDIDTLNFLFNSSISPLSSSLRATLCAASGYDLIEADYDSIEARVLLWLVKDTTALDLINQGVDLYVDMAAAIYGISIEQVSKQQRQLGKTTILSLGYGVGAAKFLQACLNYGIEIDQYTAEKIVSIYREKYKKVVQFWRQINKHAINTTGSFSKHDQFLQLKLPSGRSLHYYDPKLTVNRFDEPALSYMGVNSTTRKWERQETYGGKLTANIVQAISRDIMALGMLRVEAAGYPIVMTVHDEVVAEIPSDFGSIKEFVTLLCQKPQWALDCPITAKGWRGKRYRK